MEWDYIIVGAGAGGSVLAGRLSEDPSVSVLLLEYGPPDRNPLIYIPKGFFFTLRGDRYTYHYKTQPVGPGGQTEEWTRGKLLGGSTAVNGMMWIRGAEADFASVVALGNPGWEWDRVLAAYRSMEDHSLGGSDMRGSGGPFGVTINSLDDEVTAAILESGAAYGWDRVEDVNEDDTERIGLTSSSIKNGRRTSAYSAFVKPARKRSNLTVHTGTRVANLLFQGGRAVGVRAGHRGQVRDFEARKEVILSAGCVETPLLLERSGIGRGDVLHRLRVDVRVESPNVGERVIEQRCVNAQFRLKQNIGPTQALNTLPKQGWEGLKYLATRRGPIATAGWDTVCQFKSSPELKRPDIHGLFVSFAIDTASESMKLAKHSGILFIGYQMRPTTTSSVHASGKLPGNQPVINARFLEDEGDRTATGHILSTVRGVVAGGPLAGLVKDEEFPGPDVETHAQVVKYSIDTGAGAYHAVGSAAMGPNDDDVVDSRLRVRGVKGLRVVDASVLPIQVAANTAAPTMAVGWIAADLIREEA